MSGGEGEQEFDLKLIIKFFEEGFQVINATLDNLQSPSKFKSPWWQTYEDEYSNGKTRRRREGGLEHNKLQSLSQGSMSMEKDRDITQNEYYTNCFSFVHNKQKITLAPLSLKKVFEDQESMTN